MRAPTQGIMTVEVGAITGDVVVGVVPSRKGLHVTAAYVGAKDVYTVEGSPTTTVKTAEEVVRKLTMEGKRATRL